MSIKPSTAPGASAKNRPMSLNSSGYIDTGYFEDAAIQALLGLTAAADKLPYFDDSDSAALADFTAAGRAMVAAADAAAQLALIGAVDPAAAVFEADVDLGDFKLTNVGDPGSAGDAVNLGYMEDYVASQVTSLIWKTPAAKVATTGPLVGAYSYSAGVITFNSNGAFPSIDGVAVLVNEDVLVKNETDAEYNGLYKLTTVGDGSTQAVLTRRTDFNSSDNIRNNSVVAVSQGTSNHDTYWLLNVDGAVTVGTTELNFSNFSASVDNSTLPSALGTAAAGNASLASPANHVHPTTGLILASGANDFTAQQKFSAMAVAATANKSANYTVGSTDYLIPCGTDGGAFTVTLPSAPTIGRRIEIWKASGAADLTVACSGSDNFKINGSNTPSYVLTTVDEFVTCTYIGGNIWNIR